MSPGRYALLFPLALLLSAMPALAQPAPDCSKARTAAEKAICGDPALSTADGAMSKAYAALAKALAPGQQAGLRRDQRQWVKDRDPGCAEQKEAALTQCLLAATDKRHRFLAGEGDNGPAGAPPLVPVFYYEAKKAAYEITVAYPAFAAPVGKAFNAAAHDAVLGKDALTDYRQNGPNKFNGSSNFYQATYDIPYLDPHLASVAFQFGAYAGGAHPNNWRVGLLWDPANDRPVVLGDFLVDPDKAVTAISALCKAQGEKQEWGLFDDADFAAVVKDVKSWSIDKEGVTIMFDPYSVAPYVAGPHDCRLSYADLKEWLKPGGPLPPQ
ncbi:MAG TPA: lysozyme inhibitor LprI family protein [Stellaceae bacterium]|nr:lysozyme inhibitor LprI family protein [Stellaceae bacterium]